MKLSTVYVYESVLDYWISIMYQTRISSLDLNPRLSLINTTSFAIEITAKCSLTHHYM